jgi:sterol desaturase/sphingolipid hydroxylase (fatty acid hydroxylase superfamily)
MKLGPITIAIPLFLLAIALEAVLLRRAARWPGYRRADTLSNLGCGTLQQAVGVLIGAASAALHVAVFDAAHLVTLESSSPWTWVIAFFGVDFFYYWFHRASHEVNVLWAAHVVHHQSEDYNLGVALRQSLVQPGFSTFFYLPLTLLGVPVLVTFTMVALNALYQFWVHTELVRDLGVLEHVLNTPSHHRVHHGRNPEYVDRNHAGIFIVWDKLFGTFEPERAPVVYGITRPLRSFSPLAANLRPWQELVDDTRRLSRLRDRVRLWVAKPGWWPADAPEHPAGTFIPLETPKHEATIAAPSRATAELALAVLGTLALLVVGRAGGPWVAAAGVLGVGAVLGQMGRRARPLAA